MEPLKLGLVGLGVMGAGHLERESSLSEVLYTGVADVRPDLVEKISKQYGVKGFNSAEALIDSGECEAVLIATPHPFHPTVAEYAASKGVHILTEKPIAVTVAEADRMVAAAKKAGVLLGVMFQQRTMPLHMKAKQILGSGAIGRLYRTHLVASAWYRTQTYYDSGNWRGTWQGEGGGVIMNQAPHSLDLFIWLGGMPTEVTAQVDKRWHKIEVEDTVTAMLRYDSEIPEAPKTGAFYTSTAEWPGENHFEFIGEKGKLVIDGSKIRLYRMPRSIGEEIFSGSMWGKCAGEWEDVVYDETSSGHADVVRQFARAIRLGEPMIANGEDGVRELELANAMLLSGQKRQSVSLPLDRAEYDAFLADKRAQGRKA